MNVIVFASRKGGSGKSTLTAHLAAQAHRPSRPVLLLDSDPQGSLTLWHKLRGGGEPPLRAATEGVADLIKAAKRAGYEWVCIDPPPNMSAAVTDAIHAATLVVIPARLTVFDIAAVKETMDLCRKLGKPYAVVVSAHRTPGAPLLMANYGNADETGFVLHVFDPVNSRTLQNGGFSFVVMLFDRDGRGSAATTPAASGPAACTARR